MSTPDQNKITGIDLLAVAGEGAATIWLLTEIVKLANTFTRLTPYTESYAQALRMANSEVGLVWPAGVLSFIALFHFGYIRLWKSG